MFFYTIIIILKISIESILIIFLNINTLSISKLIFKYDIKKYIISEEKSTFKKFRLIFLNFT